jgi:hypothetical protein
MAADSHSASDGASLLRELSAFIRRFVVLSESQAVELTLWVVHTHVFQAAQATPYQNIHSAEKESGKTRLLEVLDLLVATPWLTGRVSAAALVREIDGSHPTLLLDESDAAFGRDKEYAEALREVLNMGQRRGGKATLCVGQGVNITTKRFDVFCPKAIAGIGRLPDTVAGRSVPIRLKRRAANEKVERFRQRNVEPQAQELQRRVGVWAKKNTKKLKDAWPQLPDDLSDRQQDGAEPLLAIADLVGEGWPERVRAAFVELFTRTEAQDDSIRTRLLADIRTVFQTKGSDRLSTMELLTDLAEIEASPWAEFNHGKPLTPTTLARLLRPFDILPRDVRVDSRVLKGYEREGFGDAWMRYLSPPVPLPAAEGQQGQQGAIHAPLSEIGKGQPSVSVAGLENEESPANMRVVADVAPSWGELGALSTRKTGTKPNGAKYCWIHPTNKTHWWLRDGVDPVCELCHPNPAAP